MSETATLEWNNIVEEKLKELSTNYISLETNEDVIKRRNFFYISAIFWFVWIIFHFTAIFFFGMMLQSVILVWIFLGIWNLVALILDIPVWVLQKYFKPKQLIVTSQALMLIVWFIFFKFIYAVSLMNVWNEESIIMKWIDTVFWLFLNDWLNIILLLVAACIYWAAKEINDITSLSYIMNNSDPSEYAEILSKNWLFFWWWSLVWLVISWIILALNPSAAVIFLIVIIFCLIIFTSIFFNNWSSTLNISEIKDIKFTLEKWKINTIKEFAVEKIKKTDLAKVAQSSKIIFLKPIQLKNQINLSEIIETTKNEFSHTITILFSNPWNIALIWCIVSLAFFGFWDTFVATFQIEFLNKILEASAEKWDVIIKYGKWIITWYVLLWIIVIPAFVSQLFFIKLSNKIWASKVISLWILLSWMSICALWVTDNLRLILLFGILNSFGYAAVMPLSQDAFCSFYNKDYANKLELKEIDSNASAAPLKIVSNFINILWLILGWALVWILWFNWFFIFFWACLIILLAFSIFIMQQLDF